MSLIDVCRRTARHRFGIERLRREQEAAMLAVLQGRDAFVALPTGFGKSLIYQVPAMILERPTIVVSPLIALMADQERALKDRGVPVIALQQPAARGGAPRRTRQARSRRSPRRPHHAGDARVARHRAADRARPAVAALRRRGALHLGVGARLSAVLPAARRRPRAAGQPTGARPHRDRDAARTRRHRRAAAPQRSRRADRPALPRQPAPVGARSCPVPQKIRAAGRRIRGLRRPGIIYCATTIAVDQLASVLERVGIPVVRYHGKMSRRRPDRRPASVHAADAAPDHGRDQRLRHGHRQAEHPLHRPLPGARLAGSSTCSRSGAPDATAPRRTASCCSTRPTSKSRNGFRR